MVCSYMKMDLEGLADDLLPREKAEKVGLHLKDCRECRVYYESLVLTGSYLKAAVEPPADIWAKVLDRIPENRYAGNRRGFVFRRLLPAVKPLAAGIMLCICLAAGVYGYRFLDSRMGGTSVNQPGSSAGSGSNVGDYTTQGSASGTSGQTDGIRSGQTAVTGEYADELRKSDRGKIQLDLLERYYSALNSRDWDTYLELRTLEGKEGMDAFLKNQDNIRKGIGVLGIEEARLKEIMPLPEEEASKMTRMGEYKAKYGEAAAFLGGIELKVVNESKYNFNGVNYRLIILVKEKGIWRVAEESDAPLEQLRADGFTFRSAGEDTAMRILEARFQGIEINREGKVLAYNGAQEAYLPSLQTDVKKVGRLDAALKLSSLFLKHYQTEEQDPARKLAEWNHEKVAVLQDSGDTFVFSLEFQARGTAGDWFVGNGTDTGNGFRKYTLYLITVIEDAGYRVIGWTAYP